MRLCALFGHFYREGIKIKLSRYFKFQEGLYEVVQNHYCDVRTIRPDDHGNIPNHGIYDLEGERKLCNGVVDGTLDLQDITTL